MSRRKQAKPYRLKTDGDASESGLLWDSGVMESVKTDAPANVCHSREETHICDKCCAEFFTWTELSEHHEVCTKDPLVLIVRDNVRMPIPQESSIRSSPVSSIECSEWTATESKDGAFELRHMAVNDTSIDPFKKGPDCEEVMELKLCQQDKQPLNHSTQFPDTAEPLSLLMSSAGTYSMPSTNVTLEILHSTRMAVAQFSQVLNSCDIGGKAAPAVIPVILEHLLALQQQQVHQLRLIEQICNQVTFMKKHSPQAGLHAGSSSLSITNPFPSKGVIIPSIFPISGTMSSTASEQAAVSLSSVLEKSQSPPVQLISEKHTFRDATSTSLSSENIAFPLAGSSSSSSNTDSQTNRGCTQTLSKSNQGCMEQSCLLSSSSSLPFTPQSPPSNIPFPNPLASIAATANTLHPLTALIKRRRKKLPNTLFKGKLSPEEQFFRHKCRFCAKVFGSDSALQIHLRSHTGERPFKCNICGNRFSTKGNLKVHFQRHKNKYPHVQMNPYPVPEYLDNVPTSYGIPYGMSVPSEKNVFSWLDNKPLVATLPATMDLPLSTTFTSFVGLNDSVRVTSPIKSPYQPALFETVSFSPNHRSSEAVLVSPQSSQETRTASLPQNCSLRVNLVTNIPFSSIPSSATAPEPFTLMSHSFCSLAQSLTSDETKHPADSMQASETLKLQQLVENIDKKLTDPNQCIVCHHVLGCQSALKMHYSISMDDEKEDKEAESKEEGINSSRPLILGCNCPKSFTNILNTAAPENQIKIVDISTNPSNASDIKPLTDSMNGSCQLNATCNLPEKKVEKYSEIISNMSELYSSPSALLPPVQRNSESVMIRRTDTHNRPHSKEPVAASMKKEQSEAAASAAAAAMSKDVTGIQERKLGVKKKALYNTEFQQSREQVPGQSIPYLTNSPSALGLGKTEVNGQIQGNKASGVNDPQFPVYVPATYTSVISPEMTMLLGPALPHRTAKQHNCNVCGKNFSSASALQIHERTHTGEKPFVCTVCSRAFTTKGNLKVHMGTHMWNNAPSRRGQQLPVESPMALIGGESVKFGEMIQRNLAVRPIFVDTGFSNHYATAIASSLATKNNEISMIQSRGISQLHKLPTGMARKSHTGGPINKTDIELG